ncbi:MAG TPA: carbohydrate ABC transporter permease [Firmicutes bacterium]|nr:carbohydrate ABC transporter permease [Bacillota bacterium]
MAGKAAGTARAAARKLRLRRRLLGSADSLGLLKKLAVYFFLITIGFVYLYPLLYMVVNSLMTTEDLIDPAVNWVPTSLYLDNFRVAFRVLDFGRTIGYSLLISSVCAVSQTLIGAVAGYGFARFRLPGKGLLMVLLAATFLVPEQVTMVPRYILFNAYGMNDSLWPVFLPALLGQGVKGALFILVFVMFFQSYPLALDEAAEIDGAGKLRVFLRIALPMAVPAIVVSLIFSFVWNWNETFNISLYDKDIQTLPMQLNAFVSRYQEMYPTTDGSEVNRLNEGIQMAATLITIAPLVVMYMALQKQFVESIERTGLTGE